MTRPATRALLVLALCASAGAQDPDPDVYRIIEANELSPWKVLGPFASPDRLGLETAFIDETAWDPTAEYTLPSGRVVAWVDSENELTDGVVHDLKWTGADDWDTVYLARTVTAVADHEPMVGLGMDDSAALWVNGEEAFRRDNQHAAEVDQYSTPIALRRGENTILLKIVNNRGDMAFAFRIADTIDRQARWGAGRVEDGRTHYRITTVPVPDDLVMEVGGLLFLENGALMACCRRGQIYVIHNPAEDDPAALRITTFAEGLHEPLGMLLDDDGSILVAQMPELTRLRDTDGDGRADHFETVVQPWGMSGNYHEYHFGPVRDHKGNLWGTLNIGFPSGDGPDRLYRGSAYRIRPDGEFEITCYGLRSPNGLVVNDSGDVFYTDNQGEWMDVCRLAHLQPKHYYGHEVALQWAERMPEFGWNEERTLPAVWYPYHLMRSTSGPVIDRTGGMFGPYSGQMFVGDQNNALLVRTTLQRVNGVYQGACYPFWQGFACGVNRLAFDHRGVLYAGLTERGWGSVGPRSFGIQRVHFDGPDPFDLLEVRASSDGFDLSFTAPVSQHLNLSSAEFSIREYGYRYWSTYGSDEVDSRPVEVRSVEVSTDRKRVSLATGPRNLGVAFHITLPRRLVSEAGARPIAAEAFYTLHQLPK